MQLFVAVYIALARAVRGQLVTADERLANALAHGPMANAITYLGDY